MPFNKVFGINPHPPNPPNNADTVQKGREENVKEKTAEHVDKMVKARIEANKNKIELSK